MARQYPFQWHADGGHAWLEVPADELARFGVEPSGYSYIRGTDQGAVAYLEEDCDAPAFLQAAGLMEAAQSFPERYTDGDSWIRRLPRFAA